MAEEFDYAKYLSNLLIIQYNNKPKAKATIEALSKLFPADLILSVIKAFDIDTSVGVMLDILGKYVGVDRWYSDTNGEQKQLTDDEFRDLIKLKAITNTSNSSHYDIDTSIYNFFGNKIWVESSGNMEMTFFIPSESEPVFLAARQQSALPIPLGVLANTVTTQGKKFFGFVDYQDQTAFYKTGFRDYNNPDKVGEMLTYNKTGYFK